MVSTTAVQFLRQAPAPSLPPPSLRAGVFGWLRVNLFSSPLNIALTLLCIGLIAWVVPPLVRFLLINATWSGSDREACLASPANPNPGACWAFIRVWFSYFVYGFYPIGQRWRVDVFFLALAFGIGWLAWLRAPRRDIGAVYFFIVLPILSLVLLGGLPLLGLSYVPTNLWGGILVTIVVATIGMVFSLPLGILLALGRRSRIPVVRWLSIMFIEFVRGVPLITVLFMASVMLPLFVPEPLAPDKLVRALIGVALFASAYMAEVVRGGLLAIPRGQYEAAQALGLSYWRMTGLVILPQALRVTLPNIVNVFIALFKDTTLVFIVGIFDFLRTVEVARGDQKWTSPVASLTGYVFAALFYFVCCYAMSRYARRVEARLARRSALKRR
ncbi:MAG TPA: amino acid ABC transporter permease [Xanthobacteraceae bacterium]|jgi:general L-amino acid transport system permease protein|nr:amino acid ABC transporter permease [Xanthobacteraceae bacterium]